MHEKQILVVVRHDEIHGRFPYFCQETVILIDDGDNESISQQVKNWCERMAYEYEGWHEPYFEIPTERVQPNTLRSGDRVFLPGSNLVEVARAMRGSEIEYINPLNNKIGYYIGQKYLRKLTGDVKL